MEAAVRVGKPPFAHCPSAMGVALHLQNSCSEFLVRIWFERLSRSRSFDDSLSFASHSAEYGLGASHVVDELCGDCTVKQRNIKECCQTDVRCADVFAGRSLGHSGQRLYIGEPETAVTELEAVPHKQSSIAARTARRLWRLIPQRFRWEIWSRLNR